LNRRCDSPNFQSGRVVPEYDDEAVREVMVGNYRLMYRLWSEDVEIVAVIHGARLIQEKDIPK
jgi:plasmid stabilization system protein ParE